MPDIAVERVVVAECLDCAWSLVSKQQNPGQGALLQARRHTRLKKHKTLVHRSTCYSPQPEQDHGPAKQ